MGRQPVEPEAQDRLRRTLRPAEAALGLVQTARQTDHVEQQIAEPRPRRIQRREAAPPCVERADPKPLVRIERAPAAARQRVGVARQPGPQMSALEIRGATA